MSLPYPTTTTTITLRTFINRLKKKRRMVEIGAGCFANVYASKSGRTVVKVGILPNNSWSSHANVQYLQYLALTEKHPNNPYFPKVKKVEIFEHPHHDTFFSVEMERLKEIKKNSYPISELFEYTMDDENAISAITAIFGKASDHFIQAHKVLQKMVKKYGACLDIHNENIMYRGKQLVITDPVT